MAAAKPNSLNICHSMTIIGKDENKEMQFSPKLAPALLILFWIAPVLSCKI